MKRALAVALVCLADVAVAQDKRMEVVCGNLFGARQTAIRLTQEGWSAQRIVKETLDRPEWRSASMEERKMLLDLLQETISQPGKPSSDVIRDCMRRAGGEPKSE